MVIKKSPIDRLVFVVPDDYELFVEAHFPHGQESERYKQIVDSLKKKYPTGFFTVRRKYRQDYYTPEQKSRSDAIAWPRRVEGEVETGYDTDELKEIIRGENINRVKKFLLEAVTYRRATRPPPPPRPAAAGAGAPKPVAKKAVAEDTMKLVNDYIKAGKEVVSEGVIDLASDDNGRQFLRLLRDRMGYGERTKVFQNLAAWFLITLTSNPEGKKVLKQGEKREIDFMEAPEVFLNLLTRIVKAKETGETQTVLEESLKRPTQPRFTDKQVSVLKVVFPGLTADAELDDLSETRYEYRVTVSF